MAKKKTENMTVANVGFLIENLGKECGPLQFVRELTHNSIQAIQRNNSGSGIIVWDLNHNLYAVSEEKMKKLCIVDNGIGMTGDEMVEYINKLSSSGGVQSYKENFGMGAKISAATKNPAGLIYMSWKEGKGSMVHLWKDPETKDYGIKLFPDGKTWNEVDDDLKPEMIKDHGTVVTLMGHDEMLSDTLHPPPPA